MRPSEIKVEMQDGFKGPYIDIKKLISMRVKLDIQGFAIKKSKLRGCDEYCVMQLLIGHKRCVTWHAGKSLASWLSACADYEDNLIPGEDTVFPIQDCVIVRGDDGGYYVEDADDKSKELTASELEDLCRRSTASRSR